MEDVSFDWDENNVDHLAKHNVTPEEAQQVILDPNALIVEMQSHDTEERFKTVGITARGRMLVVIFAMQGVAIRPVTSYKAPLRLRKLYFRQRTR